MSSTPTLSEAASPLSTPTDWQRQVQQAIRDPIELCKAVALPAAFHEPALRAAADFPVFAPINFVQRMNPGDPTDPLLRQVLPLEDEIRAVTGYTKDPVGDRQAKQQPGLIQKYRGRALLVASGICAIHCRYCFRRHYPYEDDPQTNEQWTPAVNQISTDSSIREIVLSGGDPLSLSDHRLEGLVRRLDRIPHLARLRVHTRLPTVIPDRVTDQLLDWLNGSRLQSYLVLHVNHANELSDEVLWQMGRLRNAGITLMNQCVLLRGVNDSLTALIHLCEKLIDHGILPYYLHQLDRVEGAAHFDVPLERGLGLVEGLRSHLPGYAVPQYVREIAGEPSKTMLH